MVSAELKPSQLDLKDVDLIGFNSSRRYVCTGGAIATASPSDEYFTAGQRFAHATATHHGDRDCWNTNALRHPEFPANRVNADVTQSAHADG